MSCVAACCSTIKMMESGKLQFNVSLVLQDGLYDPVFQEGQRRKLFRVGEIL